jgi:hypothetical protein
VESTAATTTTTGHSTTTSSSATRWNTHVVGAVFAEAIKKSFRTTQSQHVHGQHGHATQLFIPLRHISRKEISGQVE